MTLASSKTMDELHELLASFSNDSSMEGITNPAGLDVSLVLDKLDQLSRELNETVARDGQEPSVVIVALWPWQMILITICMLTAFFTLAFNLATIWVLSHCGRTISAELWKFLVSLAVADISVSLFCIPFTYTSVLLQRWVFYDFLCPVVNFAQCCSVFVSVWTLTIIGIERYFAIVHPLHLLHWLHSHKSLVITITWICGLLFGSIQLFISRVNPYDKYGKTWHECEEAWQNPLHGQIFTVVVFIVTFGAPAVILLFVYISICRNIHNNVLPGNPDSIRDQRQNTRKRKVTKMLVVIVVLFAACWLPIHVVNLLIHFVPSIYQNVSTPTDRALFFSLYLSAHFLSMAHGLVNPLIYLYSGLKFKLNLAQLASQCLQRLKRCDRSADNQEMELNAQHAKALSQAHTLTSSSLKTLRTVNCV